MESLLQFFGRLHPAVVHFPIALLMVAAGLEVARWRRREPSPAAAVCLSVAAVAAVVAVGCGWAYAHFDAAGADEALLFRHRWTGVAVAVAAVVSLASLPSARRDPDGPLLGVYRVALVLAGAGVALSGHFGGQLVYGEGYALEAFGSSRPKVEPGAVVAESDPVAVEEPVDGTPAPADGAGGAGAGADASGAGEVDFVRDVLPILDQHCYECHGPTGKARGGLRLSNTDDLLSDDEVLRILVAGDADASLLVQLIRLPVDDEDRMPAEGDPLSEDQIRIIADWIDQGAPHPDRPPSQE